MDDLEERLTEIEVRNRRVESDKAWETSYTRMISIALITYVAAVVLLYTIGADNFLIAALVPVVGFLLSTLTLPIARRWWDGRP